MALFGHARPNVGQYFCVLLLLLATLETRHIDETLVSSSTSHRSNQNKPGQQFVQLINCREAHRRRRGETEEIPGSLSYCFARFDKKLDRERKRVRVSRAMPIVRGENHLSKRKQMVWQMITFKADSEKEF